MPKILITRDGRDSDRPVICDEEHWIAWRDEECEAAWAARALAIDWAALCVMTRSRVRTAA